MCAVEYLKILSLLSRDEIISYALKLPPERVKRFISLYKLNNNEIELFKEKYNKIPFIMDTIEYYQFGNNKIYQKRI